jgi:predicted transcriptional regulator
MLAKQVSHDQEIYCTSEMPLSEVFNKMTQLGCKCMPVLESPTHKNIIGTITEHDICEKIINGGLNPHRASAGRFLNGNFMTVRAETRLEECAVLMKLSGAERIFVVDENGAFMGVLTEKDLITEKPRVKLDTVVTDFTAAPKALPAEIHLAY